MAHHKLEIDMECKSCKGTGLYVGLAERDGFAVVCHTCKGTGKAHQTIEYDDFKGKHKRQGVITVLEVNPGIVAGVGKDHEYNHHSFGGMSYQDWFVDKPFPDKSEMRQFTCPAWWYQSADYKKKPDWKECWDNLGSSFSGCKYFNSKEHCWERFDKEQIKAQTCKPTS